jgi:hypothetical protein
MRKNRAFMRLLSIFTIVTFLFGSMTTAWAGEPIAKNTHAAPSFENPFGPLEPGGLWGMRPDSLTDIAAQAALLTPEIAPVDIKALNEAAFSPDHVSVISGDVNMRFTDAALPGSPEHNTQFQLRHPRPADPDHGHRRREPYLYV